MPDKIYPPYKGISFPDLLVPFLLFDVWLAFFMISVARL